MQGTQVAPARFDVRIVALAVIAVSLFWGAVHGEFVWDDIFLIQTNTRLGEPGYWWHAFSSPFPYLGPEAQGRWGTGMYRPIISLLYGVEHQLFGLRTIGYHVVSLALHATCGVLVFLWVRRRLLTDGAGVRAGDAAGLATLLFVVHPARVESVAWISGCTDLWMTFSVLLGLFVWDRVSGIQGGLLTAALVFLALGCKENAAVIPVVLVVDGVLRGERRSTLVRAAIVLAAMIPALLLRFWIVPFGDHAALQLPWTGVLRASLATFGGYLRMTLWPWPPSATAGFLPTDEAHGGLAYPDGHVAIGAAGIALLSGFVLLAWRRPGARVWLADAAWFVLPLAPNLLPTNDWHQIADRNLYLPCLGIAALVGRALIAAARRSTRTWLLACGAAFAVCLLMISSSATHTRHFMSNDALWSYETRLHPTDTLGLINLAEVRSGQGRFAEARLLEERALRNATSQQFQRGIFEDWLEAELEDASTDEVRLKALRVALDAVAAGGFPAGELGAVYAGFDAERRDLLRSSAYFAVVRAVATAGDGDLEDARQQVAAIHVGAPAVRKDLEAMRTVSILAACGDSAGATAWLESVPGASATREGLSRLVAAAASVLGGALPPVVAQARLGFVLMSAGDPLVAHAVLRKTLALAPDAGPVVANLITVDAELGRLTEAQGYLAQLMRLDPALAAESDRVVQSLVATERRNMLASLSIQ